jgi:hypothetical protein
MPDQIQVTRRRIWKTGLAGLGAIAGAGMGVPLLSGDAQAQASGQNFDVIAWKRFPVASADFYSPSTDWTPIPTSNFGGNFNKQRAETGLWIICNLPFIPVASGTSATSGTTWMGFYVTAAPSPTVPNPQSLAVLRIGQEGYLGDIQSCSMSEIYFPTAAPFLLPAGLTVCQLYVSVETGVACTFMTTQCSFTVLEVTMPSLSPGC